MTKWLLTWWCATRRWEKSDIDGRFSGEKSNRWDAMKSRVSTFGRNVNMSGILEMIFWQHFKKNILKFLHPAIQQVLLRNLWIFEHRHHHVALLLPLLQSRKFKFPLEGCEHGRANGSFFKGLENSSQLFLKSFHLLVWRLTAKERGVKYDHFLKVVFLWIFSGKL